MTEPPDTTPYAESARLLTRLLDLAHPPVAVAFHAQPVPGDPVAAEPAGCCFWARAEHRSLVTAPADHAGCSVGGYVHGLVSLEVAASGADVAALVASDWVTPADLAAVPRVAQPSERIVYEPLALARSADVVLLRGVARTLMTLQGAVPDLVVVGRPQCQIVARAVAGEVVASPGCAVSRVRTGLPPEELSVALPASRLEEVLTRLAASAAADDAVAAYAGAGLAGLAGLAGQPGQAGQPAE